MELETVIKIMQAPEKLIDPRAISTLIGYISEFISHYEEQLNDENYIVSSKWIEIRKDASSDTKANRELELTADYRDREKTKLLLAQLRRFRADLKDRFNVLTRYAQ